MDLNEMILTDAQLKAECAKCEFCEEKPCMTACPANCSPADFIMAARLGAPQDFCRAAAEILEHNVLGTVCGFVCPERHCMAACVHKKFDDSVNIPAVQATIITRARESGMTPQFTAVTPTGKKVAVIGGGPAGLGCAAYCARKGHTVTVFEAAASAGGMCRLIPGYRQPSGILDADVEFVESLGDIKIKTGVKVDDPTLLTDEYDAVVVATGLTEPISMGVQNEDLAVTWCDFLRNPADFPMKGRVAVIGGGSVAVDCAVVAKQNGADDVEMFVLETVSEMPITDHERREILEYDINLTNRTRVTAILTLEPEGLAGLGTCRVDLDSGKTFNLTDIKDVPDSCVQRYGFSSVIVAIGSRSSAGKWKIPGLFMAGDVENGPTTVVEAVAAGKNAAAEVDAYLTQAPKPAFEKKIKSVLINPGYKHVPVPVEADFFGIPLRSPFLLSAAPCSDGLEQMRMAYEAGWAGGVMKTAFDDVPIHIPGEYMHVFENLTYGNCDNVSGHPLKRVCREIEILNKEFPDRLTIGSTGGPVTGNDEEDMAGWQANTRLLESSGARAIEYSLSCPQGGDGTEGDIVSQNASLTAKIIGWILEAGDGNVPKLFKLTGAVTSIAPILIAIRETLDRYPGKKAGVTLANSFPTLCFRPGAKQGWDEGIIVGASGFGITSISYLSLAKAAGFGVAISGNGGPMDYKAAADFLALGAETVQFCTIVLKYGYGIISELDSGLSHLMVARGIGSVKELIGIALPDPVTDFMALSAVKKISAVNTDLCLSCGNCTRCPYMAIELDEDTRPMTDPERCIGCSLCAQKCFASALYMRDRTPEEAAALKED